MGDDGRRGAGVLVGLVVALLVALPIAWFMAAGPMPSPAPAPTPAARPAKPAPPVRPAPTQIAVTAPVVTDAEPPAVTEPRPWIDVHLTGFPEGEKGDTVVTLRPGVRYDLRDWPNDPAAASAEEVVRVAALHRFRVDVPARFLAGRDVVYVALRFERPDYLPAMAVVGVEVPRNRRRDPQGQVASVEASLVPAGIAAGLVADERNGPLADVDVGAWAQDPATGRYEFFARTKTDSGGRFRLLLVPGRLHLVVAVTKDLAPASDNVRGVAGAESPTVLRLYPGYEVAGRARLDKSEDIARLSIAAVPVGVEPSFRLEPFLLGLADGVVVPFPTARIEKGGAFRVRGLPARDVALFVTGADVVRVPGVAATPPLVVVPPALGVDVGLDGRWLRVTVTDGRSPIEGARVRLLPGVVKTRTWDGAATPFFAGRTDVAGRAEVFLADVAATPQGTVEASAAGCRDGRAALVLPETEVTLVRSGPQPTTLDLTIAEADVSTAVVSVFDADSAYPLDVRNLPVDPRTHACRLDGVAPGKYRILVKAEPAGYRLPFGAPADLTAGGTQAIDVKFRHGGCLHVRWNDAGRAVLARYSVYARGDVEVAWGSTTDASTPVLGAGRYRVVASRDDGAQAAATAVVLAGETTEVDVGAAAAK